MSDHPRDSQGQEEQSQSKRRRIDSQASDSERWPQARGGMAMFSPGHNSTTSQQDVGNRFTGDTSERATGATGGEKEEEESKELATDKNSDISSSPGGMPDMVTAQHQPLVGNSSVTVPSAPFQQQVAMPNLPLMSDTLARQQLALSLGGYLYGGFPMGLGNPYALLPQNMMLVGALANPSSAALPVLSLAQASYLLGGGITGLQAANIGLIQSMFPQAALVNSAMGSVLSSSASIDDQQAAQGAYSAAGLYPPRDRQGRKLPVLYASGDENVLSKYQVLLRKQIELFEADQEDVDKTTPGRHKEITLGQVGIRCRHCTHLPLHLRSKGSVYYPSKLKGIYQAAQNLGTSHLCKSCQSIDPTLRAQLLDANVGKSSSGFGGRRFWADTAKAQGIVETEDSGLRYNSVLPSSSDQRQTDGGDGCRN